jgi:peptidyl-prolyl cis-trans isomerase D
MFMRKMRGSAKWVMLILSIAFVGWLVFDWVQSRGGDFSSELNPVVGEVGGRDIRFSDWNLYLQNQLAVARQQRGRMTEEDVRVVREQAWNDLVSQALLESELDRLGIVVTDEEIRQAFMTQPPPEFLTHPAFQTEGQFDLVKYQQFFADPSTDETLLLQIESYYRSVLPRTKLQSVIQEGIYVSDDEAWRYYRDTNESVRVRYITVDPVTAVPDSLAIVSASEVQAYYDEREDEFTRPVTARTNMLSIALQPSGADSMAALSRADSLRQRVLDGEDFAEVARVESADSVSAARGGDVGRLARDNLDATLSEAAFALSVGAVSEPVRSPFGYHLLRVDERTADTVSLRQIYVPIVLSGATEDSVFGIMDQFEDLALRTGLVTAADSMGLPFRQDVALAEGAEFVPGAGALGVAPEWAMDEALEIGELSTFFENASGFHIFELLGRTEAGRIPLEDVELTIRERLRNDRRDEVALEMVQQAVDAAAGAGQLEDLAESLGTSVQEAGPFRRTEFVPGLGQGTEAIGEAFGLPVGSASGAVNAGSAVAIVEVLERVDADRSLFEEVRAGIQQQLTFQRRQEYVQRWLAALQSTTEVRDFRAQLTAAANANANTNSPYR